VKRGLQMRNQNTLLKLSGARIVASVFGILAGLGGIIHGIGEVLQGNVEPGGIAIKSWTQGPIATNMGGEPGLTIVPNLLVTGMLTILISSAVLIWAAGFVQRKYGGRILILLSLAMLLVGGGIGPPIIGFLGGVAGTSINAPLTGWRQRLPINTRDFLTKLWPWAFGIAAISGTFLVVGSVILVFFFGLNNPNLFLNTFYLTVLSLLLTVLVTPVYDEQKTERTVLV
jgi:hypothetical protein